MKHFLSTKDLSYEDVSALLKRARFLAQSSHQEKVASKIKKSALFFFNEPSTRTYLSFAMASLHLGIEAVMTPPILSLEKGESFQDTMTIMMAMAPDVLIVRHHETEWFLHHSLSVPLINAGDGLGEHPTQAMIDLMAIASRHRILKGLKIAICGDILHSRVANSHAHLLTTLGMNLRFVGPKELILSPVANLYNIPTYHSMKQGLKDVDVVMMLRLQEERIDKNKATNDLKNLMKNNYQLTEESLALASPDVLIMHPGPVQKGMDIHEELLKCEKRNLLQTQISCGVPMRMAILESLL